MGNSTNFKKSERLSKKLLIDQLFAKKGRSISSGPLLLAYLEVPLEEAVPVQVLFSVSKRKFGKAHDRNLLKRRMRESYRELKSELYSHIQNRQKQFAMAFLYLETEKRSFADIREHMTIILDRFVETDS